ncbi:sigma-54 dependent transcriptional regulator [Rhodoplanes sp. TEM]|uniref:sigma-54-dependent transcriptional regulator n=1 Tax=Rhodoplanes TaxID=29407 RepID=UPI002350CA38|nr:MULTISPECIES: sigma-54 dependent transcriptional regulator [Rhodoplanes]MDC7985421.1 sigma-54 dependent transcriptional regulator [Rhodoplanes sp. TEM]MDQ0353616.1 two-component system repressor protein LuxO [Rhodoplanes tepidamans]
MAPEVPTIFVVEDVPTLAEQYKLFVQKDITCTVRTFATGATALAAAEKAAPSVVLLDVQLPDMNGLDILRQLKARDIPVEVIVVTGQASISLAIEAMRERAFDFIVKPVSPARLSVTVRNALERHRLVNQVAALEEEYLCDRFAGFIGRSLAMQGVYRIVQSSAASNATVFITGESGTGKELCARALHTLGKRAKGPFVTVNCAAIPRDLLESELFGHVKGAFTGAIGDRRGAALLADGGTLFLDEICEIEPMLQVKLLRFLQERTVQRVGEETARPVDIRVVCATNRDPRAEVAAGRFREDLFYRLYVVPVELPPLRQRDDDLLLIARHLLKRFAKEEGKRFTRMSAEAEQAMLSYAWPGNVRQLENVVRGVVALNDAEVVELDMLPPEMSRTGAQPPAAGRVAANGDGPPGRPAGEPGASAGRPAGRPVRPLDEVIRTTIEDAIAACDGSIPRAAAALEVSPSTLYRRIQAWNG